jgi:hypothetical protein
LGVVEVDETGRWDECKRMAKKCDKAAIKVTLTDFIEQTGLERGDWEFVDALGLLMVLVLRNRRSHRHSLFTMAERAPA